MPTSCPSASSRSETDLTASPLTRIFDVPFLPPEVSRALFMLLRPSGLPMAGPRCFAAARRFEKETLRMGERRKPRGRRAWLCLSLWLMDPSGQGVGGAVWSRHVRLD